MPNEENAIDRVMKYGWGTKMQTESGSPVHRIAAAGKALCEAMENAKNESNTVVIDTLYGLITEAFCNYMEMLTTSPKTSIYAFHARTILECLVWVRYCLADPQNAIRFNEDANRDMEGLNLALKKFADPVSGIPGALETIRWIEPNDGDHIREVLTKQITDTRYKDVKEAAKEQGHGHLYEFLYKFFSKLAHPTALIIKGNFRGEAGKPVSESCLYLATQLMGELVLEIADYLQPALDIDTAERDFHAAIHDFMRKEKTKTKEA